MQTKTFSQLSVLFAIIVTGFVMVNIVQKGVSSVPLPEFSDISTSTDPFEVDTPVMDPNYIVTSTNFPDGTATTSVAKTTFHIPTAVLTHNVNNTSITAPIVATIPLITPKGTIKALVASTTDQRETGLSGVNSMPVDTGMLFEFDSPEKYGFWMKDMQFPLDFVWILPDKTVAGVYKNISPSTYPRVFYSRLFVQYVLELNAGAATKWGIATGTQLVF